MVTYQSAAIIKTDRVRSKQNNFDRHQRKLIMKHTKFNSTRFDENNLRKSKKIHEIMRWRMI